MDADEKEVISTDTLGGRQAMSHVNELGLYQLVLSSRKSEAKEFKRWITHGVVPSIRKHGAYMTPETLEEALLNPDTLIQLATTLKQEREEKLLLERQIIDTYLVAFIRLISSRMSVFVSNELPFVFAVLYSQAYACWYALVALLNCEK